MPSTITALAILGAAVLPDGADAAIPNGWVATATLPDDGVSAFDPTRIVLTVQDYGYDTAGNLLLPGVGGPVRTIRGGAVVRKQYPNQAQRLNSASGGVRTVYFSLRSEIYASSVIADAQAEAGYYGGAAAGAIGGLSNGSTLAYPRPVFAWLNMQHERATGASFAVEAVAYHRHARNGQQVAAVKFTARDASGNVDAANAQIAGAPALSALQTQGPIVEAWKAAMPLANMPQADLCQVNAIVYPWIGDASAVLDTSDATKGAVGTLTAGSNVDDPRGETPLRFLCDKTGGYGGLVAYVKPGGTATTAAAGVFAAQQNSATLTNAQCFATYGTALTVLISAGGNGARPNAHADHSGSTIYLMDNGGAAYDHAAVAAGQAAGKCWTDIKVDPQAVGAVRLTVAGFVFTPDLIRFSVPFFVNATGNNALDGGSAVNTKRIAFDAGAVISYGASVPATGLVYRIGFSYWRNAQLVDAMGPWGKFGSNRSCAALVLGCTGNIANSPNCYPYSFVGNRISGATIASVADANWFPQSGGILANNILHKMPNGAELGGTAAIDGFARVQNVFETAAGFSAGNAAWLPANGGTAFTFTNILSMHNTVPGVGVGSSNQARQNGIYADFAAAAGVQKQMVEKYDLLHQRNTKGDTFTDLTTVTGRTGTWRYRYGVGSGGIVVVTGDASGGLGSAPDPSGGSWSGEYLEPGSTVVAGEANVSFTNNASGSAGAGGGDYSLTGVNAAYNRVPAGAAVLKYDLAGNLRRNDGTGAAGAYERTDNAPVAGAGGGQLGDVAEAGAGQVAVKGGGGGTLGPVGEAGAGGAPPATGGGGGTIGNVAGSGAGAVTDPPITAKGDIIATADRTVTPTPIPSGSGTVSGVTTAYPWAAPFDPADRTAFAIDWTRLLEAEETIAQIDDIRMSAEGASLGIQVDAAAGRAPIISTDGKMTQVWFLCDPAFQSDAAFLGAGVKVGLSVLIRTDSDPYKQFERTAVLTVREQ